MKTIDAVYMPKINQDKDEHEYNRKECAPCQLPEGVLECSHYWGGFKIEDDVFLQLSIKRICCFCGSVIRQTGGNSEGETLHSCSCSNYKGKGSPLSGSFHGGKIKRDPQTKEELLARATKEKEVIDKKYDNLVKSLGLE